MPVPDLDATVRGLYRAATGRSAWAAVLASLRDDLGAVALDVITGAAPALAGPHCVQLAPPGAADGPVVQITWPSSQPPDAATLAWLNRLAPHLHDALRAGRRLRPWPTHQALGRVLLERLPHPAWLLLADGNVAWENGLGRQERAGGRWLHAEDPRLRLRAAGQQQALATALVSVIDGPADGRLLVPVDPVAAKSADAAAEALQQAHWLLRRMDGMSAGARPPDAGHDPALLLVLFDPATADALPAAAPQQVAALGAVYGFTPAESRVALCLARGATLRGIAATLGVAPSTVRSHLDAVHAKLGVDRKLDAVRLLVQGGWMWRAGPAEGVLDA